jgi:signal transduction histidine kinase
LAESGSTDRHQKALDTLLRFSSLINSSLNIEDVLNHAMEWAEGFMDAEASSVYELDEEKNELFVRMARGEKKDPAKRLIRLKLGEGIAGRVVRTAQPVVVQDVTKEAAFSKKHDDITGFHTRSMICVPLLLRGRPIGALQVLNKKSGTPFTESDLELLTAMSQQLAVALDNAKLYDRLTKKFELTARELKVTQERLIRSERLEAMAYLVQGIAHEIRNPTTTIGGFARRIRKDLNAHSKVGQYLDIILEETERLENLVRRVREFGSLLSVRPAPHDPKEALADIVQQLEPRAKEAGVELTVAVDSGLPSIRMDPAQLTLALSNIVENAMEAMPHGGKLILSAKAEEDHVLITISDTGRGIAQEHLDSVYDPFFTSKTRGAGLGLTMVHQIIKNHGGEVRIRSDKGAGTTVDIRLPLNTRPGP